VAVQGAGKAAWLFAGVTPGMAGDLQAFARLYADSADGQITDARAAGALRQCLIGRLPAYP
jgi:predicted metal-binding protein